MRKLAAIRRGRIVAAALALVVITTALGLATAGFASASTLCRVNQTPCTAEEAYEPTEFIGASGANNTTIATNLGNIVCSTSASGKVTGVGGEGETTEVEISVFEYTGCKVGELPCGWPQQAKNLPYTAKFNGSGGSGTMTLSDPSGVGVHVTCWGISCTFAASSIEFQVTGGTPATIVASGVPMGFSGSNCPTTATFSSQLKTTSPTASLFIVGGAAPGPVTRLCFSNTNPCPKLLFRHPVGTTLEGSLEGKSTFEFLYEGKLREPACEGGALTAKTTEAGKPLIGQLSAMTFSSCGAGVCAVEAQSLPYKAEIEKTSSGNGTLALVSGGSGPPKIEVNCGKSFKCVYKATSVSLAVTGGGPAKLGASATLEKDAASETECGASMTWKATYKLTKPTAVFVTS